MTDAPLSQDARNANIVARIAEAQAIVEEQTELIDNLKLTLHRQNPEKEFSVRVGDEWFKVESYMGKQFNSDYLKKNDPVAWELAAVTVQTVTAASAKAKLTPEEYAKGQKPNTKPTVKVSLLND